MQNRQTLIAGQRVRPDAQRFEIGENIRLNAFQPGFGFFQTCRLNAECDIFRLGQTVVALACLIFQHIRIFHADRVKFVPLFLDMNRALKFLHIRPLIQK